MTCTVLLFAQLAETLGVRELSLDLERGATVDDAIELLSTRHEAIAALRGRLAVAVDETYADGATVLPAGCTMALIPPVSGG